MSVDLDFWKYEDGVSLNPAEVYQRACCDGEAVSGLAALPVDAILGEVAAAFPDWHALDALNYESAEQGSFQITATPQAVRFDCCGMKPAEMKRFPALLAKFDCPLYDPQQGVRFDQIAAFLTGEAAGYESCVKQELARLLPRLKVTAQAVTWEEYTQRAKAPGGIQYDAIIHRGTTMTKAVSTIQFGRAWASRFCQSKTVQLDHTQLEELLQKSLSRVVRDFLAKTYYTNC